MTLSDRSEIYLASFSAMSLTGHRAVELQSGMAWFEVTRGDVQFTVEIPSYGSVRALGTSFGIILDPDGDECSIAVASGRVIVENKEGRQILSSGEEAGIALGRNPVKHEAQRLARMLAFRDRLVRDRNEYELKKYYPSLAPPSYPVGTR
jgi:ferric-dicitrate binding protein FerR (iron transport regulator)